MQQVLDFLNKAGVFFLATADGDQPHVRPLGFVMDCGGQTHLLHRKHQAHVQATCG